MTKAQPDMPIAIVLFSGGQDSTTCLYWARQRFNVIALSINYGQRHQIELSAANNIAKLAEVYHQIITVKDVLTGTSPLVSDAKLEQYADHASLPGGLEKTLVPMRNQFFLTIAANYAYTMGSSAIVTGVCQEDYGGYPDCRREFIDAFENVSNLGTFTNQPETRPPLHVLTPLMDLTKAQSVVMAVNIPGCYKALAHSHTAYDGLYPPVGHDHASLLRAKGFEHANIPDPLVLRAVHEGYMKYPDTPNYRQSLVSSYSFLAGIGL